MACSVNTNVCLYLFKKKKSDTQGALRFVKSNLHLAW